VVTTEVAVGAAPTVAAVAAEGAVRTVEVAGATPAEDTADLISNPLPVTRILTPPSLKAWFIVVLGQRRYFMCERSSPV
jgi:hypothetical protein